MTGRGGGCGTSTCPKGQESPSRGGRRGNGGFDQAGGGEDVVWVEGGFETALEDEIGAGRAPDVDGALEGGGAPEEYGGGIFFCAQLEDGGSDFGEAADGIGVIASREQGEIECAAGAGYEGVREAGAFGDLVQG